MKSWNTEKVAKFKLIYAEKLATAMEKDLKKPQSEREYSWDGDLYHSAYITAGKGVNSFLENPNGVNLDGKGWTNTCNHFGIKKSRAALIEFFEIQELAEDEPEELTETKVEVTEEKPARSLTNLDILSLQIQAAKIAEQEYSCTKSLHAIFHGMQHEVFINSFGEAGFVTFSVVNGIVECYLDNPHFKLF